MTVPFMGIEAVIREQAGKFPLERGRERDGGTTFRKSLLILGPKPVENKTRISFRATLLGIFANLPGTEIRGPGHGEDVEIEIPGDIPGGITSVNWGGQDKSHNQQI